MVDRRLWKPGQMHRLGKNPEDTGARMVIGRLYPSKESRYVRQAFVLRSFNAHTAASDLLGRYCTRYVDLLVANAGSNLRRR